MPQYAERLTVSMTCRGWPSWRRRGRTSVTPLPRTPGDEPDESATPDGVLARLAALMPAWRAGEYSRVRPQLGPLVRDALSLGTVT
jgi:hypothetical protein